ncbi:MAG: aspartyl protease family protein [Alphaproteobacteria bacterium]|nr:aspartyl protease family protein [Alphaproteobacteria bacterium]
MMSLLLDHLWQSSLCVGGAALIAVALRRNSAGVRFWVWFAASLKFLVPFATLTALGSTVLAPMVPPVAVPRVALAEPLAKPFSGPTIIHFTARLTGTPPSHQPAAQPAAPAEPDSAIRAPLADRAALIAPRFPSVPFDLESVLLAIWAAGSLILAIRWLSRWFRVRALLRHATQTQLDLPVAVKLSASLLEPGLAGIFSPVILLPQGIAQQLSPVEMKAVLAHELCHWRRHDNLLAAIHMLVEVLFWFFPLVWWIGARLNAERERACDESVLAEGNEPQIYADGILKVCRAYLQSPLACVSGISGAGLKSRIAAIMENRLVLRLNAARKFALSASAAATLGLPVALGLLAAPAVQMPAKAAPIALPARQARAEQAPSLKPEISTALPESQTTENPPGSDKLPLLPQQSRVTARGLAVSPLDLPQLAMAAPDLAASNDPAPAQPAPNDALAVAALRNDQPNAPMPSEPVRTNPNCAPPELLNSLPMEKVPGSDSMTVMATIDGNPARLLVGMGTMRTQLWHNTALKLDPAVENNVRVSRFILGSMDASGFPIEANTTPVFAPPLFDGILGTDMMQSYDIDLDFAHGKLNYFSPEQCVGAGVYWNPTTITSMNVKSSVRVMARAGLITVPVTLDGHEIIALLDTGADRTFLNPKMASMLFGLDAGSLETANLTVGGAVTKAGLHTFSRLTIGGLTADNPRIAIPLDTEIPNLFQIRPDSAKMFPPRDTLVFPGYYNDLPDELPLLDPRRQSGTLPIMVIGMDLLKHSHLYISFRNRRVYISAAGDGPALKAAPATRSALNIRRNYGPQAMGGLVGRGSYPEPGRQNPQNPDR